MTVFKPYLSDIEAPTRTDVDALPGLTVLEFGTTWCGHCRAAQPAIAEALAQPTPWRHIRVEDGPGQPLGRSFRVKLWPTLVLLKDGQEVSVLVNGETDMPMSVELPDKIVLLVTYSEPGMKGDTATRTLKPATVETGATVNVPLFVNEGELIRVNSKTGEYIERVKD